jgi:hypothetical protein
MKFRSLLFGAMLLSVLAVHAATSDVAMNTANVAGQLQISGPADHTGWQLQSPTNNLTSGLGTNWINVPASMQTNQMTVAIEFNGRRGIFPVGAALLARLGGIREHLNPN